jgi:hypothetical protein
MGSPPVAEKRSASPGDAAFSISTWRATPPTSPNWWIERRHNSLSFPAESGGWRATASVDSHRSGMIVYKEKNDYGFDTSEVHSRV